MREKVTFNLRSPFPELESICYLFNKMMISGKGNHAELKIGKSKDIDYITINVYRCRKYPSVTLNRDVDLMIYRIIPVNWQSFHLSNLIILLLCWMLNLN